MVSPRKDVGAEPETQRIGRSSDDDFSSADNPRPATLKRKIKTTKKAARPKKKERQNPELQPDAYLAAEYQEEVASQNTLGPTRTTASSVTENLNAWLAVRDQISVKHGKKTRPSGIPQLMETPLTPLGDLPDMPNRDFAFNIQLKDVEVNWDPREGEETAPSALSSPDQRKMIEKCYKTIKTWRVFVFNRALPETEWVQLRLFPEFQRTASKLRGAKEAAHMKYILRGGPLDIDICPTQSQAEQVAAEACRLLNKYPQEIDNKEFPDKQKTTVTGLRYFPMTSVIELMSMRAIEEDFDFRRIRYVFQVDGQYRLRIEPIRCNRSRTSRGGYEIRVPGFLTGKGKSALVTLPADFLEANGFDELPTPPSSWGFSSVPPKVKKTVKLLNTVPSKGNPAASTNMAESDAGVEALSGFATKSTEDLKDIEHTAEAKTAKPIDVQDKEEDYDPKIQPQTLAKLIDFIT